MEKEEIFKISKELYESEELIKDLRKLMCRLDAEVKEKYKTIQDWLEENNEESKIKELIKSCPDVETRSVLMSIVRKVMPLVWLKCN